MIKANAYGHGLIQVARILDEADAFAVARLEEAIQLREAGIRKRLVVLGGCLTAEEIRAAPRTSISMWSYIPCQQVPVAGSDGRGQPPWPAGSRSTPAWAGLVSSLRQCRMRARAPGFAPAVSSADPDDAPWLCRRPYGPCDARAAAESCSSVLGGWDGDVSIANSAAILQWPDTLRSGGRAALFRPQLGSARNHAVRGVAAARPAGRVIWVAAGHVL